MKGEKGEKGEGQGDQPDQPKSIRKLLPLNPTTKTAQARAEAVSGYIEPHVAEILEKAIELAKLGDPSSMKLLMERFTPVLKPEDEKVLVPGFTEQPTLEGKSAAVMSAVASGAISAAAGQRLLGLLETHVRVVTATDIEQRLSALEKGTLGTPAKLVGRSSIGSDGGRVIDDIDIA